MCPFSMIFVFTLSHIMLKISFIKIILVKIICIFCLHKFFNSFFVFNRWITSTIKFSNVLQVVLNTFQASIYLLPVKMYVLFHSFYTQMKQNSMSPNNGILFNGVLKPKLINNPFASCPFINIDLLPHTAHFDDNIGLPILVCNTFKLTFSLSILCYQLLQKLLEMVFVELFLDQQLKLFVYLRSQSTLKNCKF